MHRTNPSTDLLALKPIRTLAPKGANHWKCTNYQSGSLERFLGQCQALLRFLVSLDWVFCLVLQKKLVGREFVLCVRKLKSYGFMEAFVLKENPYLVSSSVLLGWEVLVQRAISETYIQPALGSWTCPGLYDHCYLPVLCQEAEKQSAWNNKWVNVYTDVMAGALQTVCGGSLSVKNGQCVNLWLCQVIFMAKGMSIVVIDQQRIYI